MSIFGSTHELAARHPEWSADRVTAVRNNQLLGMAAAAMVLSEPRDSDSQHASFAPLTESQSAYVDRIYSGPIMSKVAAALWFVRNVVVYGTVLAGLSGLGFLGWLAYKTFS